MHFLKTLLVVIVLLIAAGLGWTYSGLYDIGADAPHWPLTAKLIDALRERSIETRLSDIQVPNLDDPELVKFGGMHYSEMCTGCHLAPGMEETEIRAGLYPQPPKLAEPWPSDPREQFWAIKHGIKLTAMPAWGKTHDDHAIWAMVAFLKRLPGLSPQEYQALTDSGEDSEESDHHHHSE